MISNYSAKTMTRLSVQGLEKFWLLIVVSILLLPSQAFAESEDASRWLVKINKACSGTSFVGTFVYIHDNEVEAMQVVRRVRNGQMQERLYALSGEAREVVRDMERVWCYIPDKNMGVHDFRQAVESSFPNILPNDLEEVRRNYVFELGVEQRIANRLAQQVKVIPRDSMRYGYHLWADSEKGFLLRSDLIAPDQRVIEQYIFVNIDFDREISDQELAAVSNKEGLDWYGMNHEKLDAVIEKKQWFIEELPVGYRLTKHLRRMNPMTMDEEEHLVITDGLSSVSVFVKEAKQGQSGMEGLSTMGAINAYRTTHESRWITVMGEVPAETVKFIAGRVIYRP